MPPAPSTHLRCDAPVFTLFQQARESYLQRRFSQARRLMLAYRRAVDYRLFPQQDRRRTGTVHVSVVVVTLEAGPGLEACLRSLAVQTNPDFEIIVVDNGGRAVPPESLADLPLLWIGAPMNFLPSEGRNVGARFARGDTLIFLDDGAQVGPEYVETARAALERPDLMAVRGRVLPKSISSGPLPAHYDLGADPRPANLNVEGNMAISRQVFEAVAGFDPLVFGHEGQELTHRCLERFPHRDIFYWPDLIIRHDYAAGSRLEAKKNRQKLAMDYFRAVCPAALKLFNRGRPVVEQPSTTNGPHQRSENARQDMKNKGISIILRHTGAPSEVTALLDSLLRHNTHKPLEMIMASDQPEAMILAVQPYVSRLFIRVLPPSAMSAENSLSALVSRARHGLLLFIDAQVRFNSDVLSQWGSQLENIGVAASFDKDSLLGGAWLLFAATTLDGMDGLSADMSISLLAERLGAIKVQQETMVPQVAEKVKAGTLTIEKKKGPINLSDHEISKFPLEIQIDILGKKLQKKDAELNELYNHINNLDIKYNTLSVASKEAIQLKLEIRKLVDDSNSKLKHMIQKMSELENLRVVYYTR